MKSLILFFLCISFSTLLAGPGKGGEMYVGLNLPVQKEMQKYVASKYEKANVSVPEANKLNDKYYFTGEIYDSINNPNDKYMMYIVQDSVIKTITYEDVIDDIPNLGKRANNRGGIQYWFDCLPRILNNDEIMFTAPIIDTIPGTRITQPTRFVKYNLETKKAEIINHPIYDFRAGETVPQLLCKWFGQNPYTGQIWALVEDYKNYQSFTQYILSEWWGMFCIYDQEKNEFRPCGGNYIVWTMVATGWPKQHLLHFPTATGGEAWIRLDYWREDPFSIADDSLFIYDYGKDQVKGYSYLNDLGGAKYNGINSVYSGADTCTYVIDANCQVSIVKPDGSVEIDTWLKDFYPTVYPEFDYKEKIPEICTDELGNAYILMHKDIYLYKRSKNGDWTVYNLQKIFDNDSLVTTDVGMKFRNLRYVDNRYFHIYGDKRGYTYIFDTKYDEDAGVEDYLVKDFNVAKLYPNPSDGKVLTEINLQRRGVTDMQIQLINSLGVVVLDLTDKVKFDGLHGTLEFDTSTLPKGFYYLCMKSNRSSKYKGVIVE